MVAFDALQQTAGRRAVLRDREAFPMFVEAVRSIEPAVQQVVERITRDVDERTVDRLADTVRRIFGKVLRELSDLDNPMRTMVGTIEGEGGLFEEPGAERDPTEEPEPGLEEPPALREPTEVVPPARDPVDEEPKRAGDGRSRKLPDLQADPSPDGVRSRYDPEARVVYFNDQHADYLMVKEDESSLLDYLSTLVAKELVVYNNPRTDPNELAEEMVRMLVRVRRHTPRRR